MKDTAATALPAWINEERIRFGAFFLAVFSLAPLAVTWRYVNLSDWSVFAAAGHHAGSATLLHPLHLSESFPYTPGAAWAFVPFNALSLAGGLFVNAAIMLGCAAAAAAVATHVYRVSLPHAAALVFAWAPTMNAAVIGQNSPLGLLLALLTLLGLERGSVALTGVSLGILLYKPTYALPLIAVLVLRARWRELAIVAAIGLAWYALSAWASGGDWLFGVAWSRSLHDWTVVDFPQNQEKAVSIPSLLMRAHLPFVPAMLVATLTAVAFIPLLRRAPIVVAGSAACVIGLAVSPHAWGYDGVLILPTIFVIVERLRGTVRAAVVAGAYVLAALLTLLPVLHFDSVALVVLGALAWWAFADRSSFRSGELGT